ILLIFFLCGMFLFFFFFFYCSRDLRDLHSFPTRRSSDLFAGQSAPAAAAGFFRRDQRGLPDHGGRADDADGPRRRRPTPWSGSRSEEHTSELQSRRDLVCRHLLVKKKKKKKKKKDIKRIH